MTLCGENTENEANDITNKDPNNLDAEKNGSNTCSVRQYKKNWLKLQ